MVTTPGSSELQLCLERACDGDEEALNRLISLTRDRLRLFAHTVLRGDRVRQWEDTDDLLQQSLVELQKVLSQVRPNSLRQYYRLAGFHMRRCLVRLARHYFGPHGAGTMVRPLVLPESSSVYQPTEPVCEREPTTEHLEKRDGWAKMQAEIERLDSELKDVVDLIWMAGLTHAEAAVALDVSTKTVQRRWQRARLALYNAFDGEMPWG